MESPKYNLDLIELARSVASDSLDREGEVMTHALVVSADRHVYVPGIFTDTRAKDVFAMTVRALGLTLRAKAVVFLSESWSFRGNTPEELKRYEAWRDAQGPEWSLGDYPGRLEVIVMRAETHEGTSMVIAEILRDESGKPSLGPSGEITFEPINPEDTMGTLQFSGRMTHLLLPKELQDSEKAQAAAQLYLTIKGAKEVKIDPDNLDGTMEAVRMAEAGEQPGTLN